MYDRLSSSLMLCSSLSYKQDGGNQEACPKGIEISRVLGLIGVLGTRLAVYRIRANPSHPHKYW